MSAGRIGSGPSPESPPPEHDPGLRSAPSAGGSARDVATIERYLAEALRLGLLTAVEGALAACGRWRPAGVDEAGRGCLAGPVVAAAVVPDPERPVAGVDDSKKLAPDLRRRLAERVRASALAWSVVAVEPGRIDRVNILEATREAMSRAVAGLDPAPDCVLADAVTVTTSPVPWLALVRGDAISHAIACASVIAKVERDRLMTELDDRYPHYGFRRHKGYAAPEHLRALDRFGPCPQHRLTFASVLPRSAGAA